MVSKTDTTSTDKLAVIKLGTSQFIIKPGDTIKAEKSSLADNKKVQLTDVLLYSDNTQTLIGTPVLKNVTVSNSSRFHEREKTQGSTIQI